MEFRGSRQCPICKERCYPSQLKEGVRSRLPKTKTIQVCVECFEDWRTDPEYEHLRPDLSPEEADEIKEKREFYQENWIP